MPKICPNKDTFLHPSRKIDNTLMHLTWLTSVPPTILGNFFTPHLQFIAVLKHNVAAVVDAEAAWLDLGVRRSPILSHCCVSALYRRTSERKEYLCSVGQWVCHPPVTMKCVLMLTPCSPSLLEGSSTEYCHSDDPGSRISVEARSVPDCNRDAGL